MQGVRGMYINYSKLWRLLAEKGLSKSDLMELTGLSSRVVAKLTKNETVTTDTIAKICTALSCGVSDVMECVSESDISLYQYFRSFGKVIEENENVKKVAFTFREQKYAVYITKETATKATQIMCADNGSVYWRQYRISFAHMSSFGTSAAGPLNDVKVLVKPTRAADEIAIVVIKGKPSIISGLDEGVWVSAAYGKLKGKNDIFVMTEASFKLFSPKL